MDLRFSEEQQLIQQQAREFMEKQCPLERVRELWESGDGIDDALWGEMAALGWMGMLLPEAAGGLGLSVTDMSRVLEEMGRGLLPGPFLAHLLGSYALMVAGDADQHAQWLPQLASGEQKIALALCGEGGRPGEQGGDFTAEAAGEGFILHGAKTAVPGAAQADRIVVMANLTDAAFMDAAAFLGSGIAWFVIEADSPGVTIQPLRAMEEGIKQARVRLDGVAVASANRLANAPGGEVMAQVCHLCDVALAFDALGGAEQAMTMAVDYAKLREAFGQPIGSYQAIKHKCADMLYGVESLRAIALWAAWILDTPAAERTVSARMATAMARSTAIGTYDLVVRHATQVQGAIATTEEHNMHMFAKRSRILALSYSPLDYYQEIILEENGFPLIASSD